MAGKTKNMLQRRTFLGGEEQWSEGHGYDLAVNLGAISSLKRHSFILRPSFKQISQCYLKRV